VQYGQRHESHRIEFIQGKCHGFVGDADLQGRFTSEWRAMTGHGRKPTPEVDL
jgi:hypothetical protein